MAQDSETLTKEDMQQWLTNEIRYLMKTTEMRVRDATQFVSAYALGKLTPEAAMDRLTLYESRWGDCPSGPSDPSQGLSDEEVLRDVERTIPSSLLASLKASGPRGGHSR